MSPSPNLPRCVMPFWTHAHAFSLYDNVNQCIPWSSNNRSFFTLQFVRGRFPWDYVSGCSQDIVDTVYVSTLKPGRFPIYAYAMHRWTSQDIAQRLSSLINNSAFFALQSVRARVVVSKTTMYVDTPKILLTRHLSTHWDQVGLVFMSLTRTVSKDIARDENHDQSKAEHFCMHQIQIGRNVVLTFQFPWNICLYYYATVRVNNLYDMLVPRRR